MRMRAAVLEQFGRPLAATQLIQIKLADGRKFWGAAVDTNIELAPIKALLSAVNHSLQ